MFILQILLSLILVRSDATPSSAPAGTDALWRAAHDKVVRQAMFEAPKRLLTGSIGSTGAMAENQDWEAGKREDWNIERQRYGADWVTAGLVTGKDDVTKKGWSATEWGLKQVGDGGVFGTSQGGFHSSSMFLEAAARSLLLLKAQGGSEYSDQVSTYTPILHAAARHFLEPKFMEGGKRRNQPYTHRRWLLAAGLQESGKLTGDSELVEAAATFAEDGLALQGADGTNPEKGGFDVTYQCLGLLMAERYYWYLDDQALRARVRKMVEKGLQRELEAVGTDGVVTAEGSTRTGVDPEHGRAKAKGINYREVVQCLAYGADITGDERFAVAAEKVARAHGWLGGY